nr:isomerase [Afipia sp.]
MKLATCRLNDKERVAIVHHGDTSLFDIAAASSRAGNANPVF